MAEEEEPIPDYDDLLVKGYCRAIEKLLKRIIALEIMDLCFKYFNITNILTISVGKAGNTLNNKFYQGLLKEYNLNNKGISMDNNDIHNTYFRKSISLNDKSIRYIPRSIFTDLEPGYMDTIKQSAVYDPDCLCFAASGGAKQFATGYYTDGAELIDEIMDIIRQQSENYDHPQGIRTDA